MRILLSLSEELYGGIKEVSKEKGLSVSSLIRYILTEYLRNNVWQEGQGKVRVQKRGDEDVLEKEEVNRSYRG
jgi:metal-responsive CopG/Arc/MetJ family transcriptional regulator